MTEYIMDHLIGVLMTLCIVVLVITLALGYYYDWFDDLEIWPFASGLQFSVKMDKDDHLEIRYPIVEEEISELGSPCKIFISWAEWKNGRWYYYKPVNQDYSVSTGWDEDYLVGTANKPDDYSIARVWASCGSDYIAATSSDYLRAKMVKCGGGLKIDPYQIAYEFLIEDGKPKLTKDILPYRY